MWAFVAFAALALFVPILMSQFSSVLGNEGELLDKSFAEQQADVHGTKMPASSLRVLYRWRTHVLRGNNGGIMEVDANWLCRTEDGLYVVALAVGEGSFEATWFSQPKPVIRWMWRSMTEQRARQLLAATPSAYREVFGSAPGKQP